MFKRLKNLLELSRYSVDELRSPSDMAVRPGETMSDYYERTWGEPVTTVSDVTYTHSTDSHMAQIIDLREEDPFKDIAHDTTEQSSDDTAARNG